MDIIINGVVVAIYGLEPEHLNAINAHLKASLADSFKKNRDAIADAFEFGISIAPAVNPSDLWHHVLYREFVRAAGQVETVSNPSQSWVRSSGDAFELFLQNYYSKRLRAYGIEVTALFTPRDKRASLNDMRIHDEVGSAKLDLSIRHQGRILGGIHAKVSLAERVSDDVPASLAMMRKGFLSALVTLDVKSFPISPNVTETRAYYNKGELGTPERPSDKRNYIEHHGSFDMCLSYNLRTVPSAVITPSNKKIYVTKLGSREPDELEEAIKARI